VVELREPVSFRIRRWTFVLLLVSLAVAVVLVMQRRNSAVASSQCSALYKTARTAADTAQADAARPGVGGRDEVSAIPCGQRRARGALRPPQFSDYAADTAFVGPIAELNFARDTAVRRFRTTLRDGVIGGPNFAGHFALVTWGCGTECQSYAIVDLVDGIVRGEGGLDFSCHLVDYTRTSRLVVMTPADTEPGHVCYSKETIWLLWSGVKFDTLR
jgi:hypothetical protein